MKNELRRHQRGDKIKWVIAFAAILLLAGGLTLICMQLFSPYKPSNGFKKAETQATQAVGIGVKRAIGAPIKDGTTGTLVVYTNSGNYEVPYTCAVTSHSTPGYTDQDGNVVGASSWTDVLLSVDMSSLPEFADLEMVLDYTPNSVNGTWTALTPEGTNYKYSAKNALGGMLKIHFTATTINYIPLPEPTTKEGYTFTGWYTDEACTNKYEGETVREDMTLYAGWQINTYTVTYDANGGTACDSVTVDWNTVPTLPTTTRIGYKFLGWALADGSTYEGTPIKQDTALTAKWEILTFTVTFMSDGAVYKTMTVEYGTSLTDVMTSPELAVYNVVAYSGLTVPDGATELTVTADAEVEIEQTIGLDKAVQYVKANWIWLTVCLAGAAVVIGIITALASRSGKRRYYR